MEYHEVVRQNYLEQVKADPKRYTVIDASRSVQEVHEDVVKTVEGLT